MPIIEISREQESQIIDFIKEKNGKVSEYPGNIIGHIDLEPIVILHEIMVSATGNPQVVQVFRLLPEQDGTNTLICSDKHAEWIEQAGIADFLEEPVQDAQTS